jgi:hypothetical protein
MNRKLLAALAVMIAWIGPTHALMGRRPLPDQTVQTPAGPVTLTHLRYIEQAGVYTLLGDALNGTGHDWIELVLAVSLTDKDGPVGMRTTWGQGQPSVPKMYIHLISVLRR